MISPRSTDLSLFFKKSGPLLTCSLPLKRFLRKPRSSRVCGCLSSSGSNKGKELVSCLVSGIWCLFCFVKGNCATSSAQPARTQTVGVALWLVVPLHKQITAAGCACTALSPATAAGALATAALATGALSWNCWAVDCNYQPAVRQPRALTSNMMHCRTSILQQNLQPFFLMSVRCLCFDCHKKNVLQTCCPFPESMQPINVKWTCILRNFLKYQLAFKMNSKVLVLENFCELKSQSMTLPMSSFACKEWPKRRRNIMPKRKEKSSFFLSQNNPAASWHITAIVRDCQNLPISLFARTRALYVAVPLVINLGYNTI